MELWVAAAGAAGLALGALLAWLARGSAVAAAVAERDAGRREAEAARGETVDAKRRVVETETARRELAERLARFEGEAAERDRAHVEHQKRLEERFEMLAGKALDGARVKLGEQAEALLKHHRDAADAKLGERQTSIAELIAPMRDTLSRYEERLKEVETARNEAYGGLKEQVALLAQGHQRAIEETSRLGTALRTSGKAAGSWGEGQLRNTLELAGLRENIDFTLQTTASSEDGDKRPDAVIRLPGGRSIIVDSKCSLGDYLAAGASGDEEARRAAMKRHAQCVRAHAKNLADKAYWRDFGQSADFVVLFLAGENFLAAALEHDLPLLDWAFEQRVLIAGPINLLAIAKTVALVWRQEKLAEEAKAIGKLGADLHASVAVFAEHVAGMGKNLRQAVNGYNDMIGSLERNVLPKARRFTELGVEAGKKPVPLLGVVEPTPAAPTSPELLAPLAKEAAE